MKTKSYEVIRSGRRAVQEAVTSRSQGTCTVQTDDMESSLAHLLERDESHLVVGTCVDQSRNRWEILKIARNRVRSFSQLN